MISFAERSESKTQNTKIENTKIEINKTYVTCKITIVEQKYGLQIIVKHHLSIPFISVLNIPLNQNILREVRHCRFYTIDTIYCT